MGGICFLKSAIFFLTLDKLISFVSFNWMHFCNKNYYAQVNHAHKLVLYH